MQKEKVLVVPPPRGGHGHHFAIFFPGFFPQFFGGLYINQITLNTESCRFFFVFLILYHFFISLCPRKLLASMVFSLPGGKKEIFTGPPVLTGEIQTLSHGFPLHPTFTNSRTLHAEL